MLIAKKQIRHWFIGLAAATTLVVSGCASAPPTAKDDAMTTSSQKASASEPAEAPKAAGANGQPEKSMPKLTEIDAIKVGDTGDKIVISSNAPLKYTVFKLDAPSRLIVDLPSVNMEKVLSPITVNNNYITEIASSVTGDNKDFGRVSIGLREGVDYEVKAGENSIMVNLVGPPPTQAAAPVKEEPKLPAATKITGVESAVSGDITVVKIVSDGAIGNYNAFELESPSRLIVDLWGVKNSVGKDKLAINKKYVKSVRIGTSKDKIRVVLDLATAKIPGHVVTKEGNALLVTIGSEKELEAIKSTQKAAEQKAAVEAAPVAAVAETAPVSAAAVAPAAEPVQPAAKAADEKAQPAKPAAQATAVERIEYKRLVESTGRLTIATSEKVKFEVVTSEDGRSLVIDLKGAVIPDQLKKTLDASKLKTPVATVSSYQESVSPENDVRILVKLSDRSKHTIKEAENVVNIDFEPIAAVSEKAGGKEDSLDDFAEESSDSGLKGRKYSGKKITIDMVDANVLDIFRLLAEERNYNLITSDDVTGTITLKLRDVPWKQVLDIVLKTKQLDAVLDGNVMRIAPISKIRAEKESAQAAKKALEKLEPLDVKFIPINYATADEIMGQVKSSLSDRGSVTSDKRTNTLIVKDTQKAISSVESVVAKLDTPIPQVLIEARIVNATSSFSRSLGIQWGVDTRIDGKYTTNNTINSSIFGATANPGSVAPNPSVPTVNTTANTSTGTSYAMNSNTSGPRYDAGVTNYAVSLPAASQLGALGFVVGRGGSNPLLLDLRLSAGESQGMSKIISRPRIIVLDNKDAKIEQGESLPFETAGAQGSTTTFIDANLSLTVTPHITPDGSVLMKLKVNDNQPGNTSVSGKPSIQKREASTEVLVKDGETTVLGGVIKNNFSEDVTGIPFLKDIPILGWFFKNKSVRDDKAELLIFITPTIIKTTAQKPA